jgi:nitrite reductase/ring-hydroxylating ferredoxin subunit
VPVRAGAGDAEIGLCLGKLRPAEERQIFAREWLCAGRADALPNPGDYLTMEIAGEPVIILRDRDGALRGMSNVCRHRMSTLLEGRGNTRSIVCPYHAWTYNLDGTLRGAPAMALNEVLLQGGCGAARDPGRGLAGLDHGHAEPRCAPRRSHAGEGVDRLVGHLAMAGLYRNLPRGIPLGTNWKVLAENFMESYHLPVCHSGTIGGAAT